MWARQYPTVSAPSRPPRHELATRDHRREARSLVGNNAVLGRAGQEVQVMAEIQMANWPDARSQTNPQFVGLQVPDFDDAVGLIRPGLGEISGQTAVGC